MGTTTARNDIRKSLYNTNGITSVATLIVHSPVGKLIELTNI